MIHFWCKTCQILIPKYMNIIVLKEWIGIIPLTRKIVVIIYQSVKVLKRTKHLIKSRNRKQTMEGFAFFMQQWFVSGLNNRVLIGKHYSKQSESLPHTSQITVPFSSQSSNKHQLLPASTAVRKVKYCRSLITWNLHPSQKMWIQYVQRKSRSGRQ